MLKRRLREPFGKAGLIVAVTALVFAMLGGAYAASGGLSGKEKKEVKKIAQKFAGVNGQNGANGLPGAKGDAGSPGAKGDSGANGSAGKGVLVAEEDPGANCFEGGVSVELEGSGSKRYVCNGEEGPEGPQGPPGPVTAELQPGKTETGSWSFGGTTAEQEKGFYPLDVLISFPLALPADQTELPAVFVTAEEVEEGTQPSECAGSAEQPTAAKGFLCVYQSQGEGATFTTFRNPNISGISGAGRNGAILYFTGLEEFGYGIGTWAVTAEE